VTWLVSQNLHCLCAKSAYFVAFLVAFTLPKLYKDQQAHIQDAIRRYGVPSIDAANKYINVVREKVSLQVGAGILALGALLSMVGVVSFCFWLSLCAVGVVAVNYIPMLKPHRL